MGSEGRTELFLSAESPEPCRIAHWSKPGRTSLCPLVDRFGLHPASATFPVRPHSLCIRTGQMTPGGQNMNQSQTFHIVEYLR